MQAMSLNFALAQKEKKSFTTCKDQSKRLRNRCARYISYQWYFKWFIEVFNASLWRILQRVYLTKCRSTSRTVQWLLLVTKTNHFIYVSEWNKYSKSIATQLYYWHTPIDTLVYEKFVCYNHKTKYTDWCPIQQDGGWAFVYICEFFPWTPTTTL